MSQTTRERSSSSDGAPIFCMSGSRRVGPSRDDEADECNNGESCSAEQGGCWRCCQSPANWPPKPPKSRRSGRQLTPLGQGGGTVLLEDIAAMNPPLPDLRGEHRTEPVPPGPHRAQHRSTRRGRCRYHARTGSPRLVQATADNGYTSSPRGGSPRASCCNTGRDFASLQTTELPCPPQADLL